MCLSSTHRRKDVIYMAVLRKTAPSRKDTKLKPTLKTVNTKGKLEVLKLPMYEEVDYGSEVLGRVTDCDIVENNPDYVRLVVALYYNYEGSSYVFMYNIKKESANYLHRFASLFAEYKLSFNLYSIIGKYFIGKVKKNKGYLNLVGIRSISRDEFEAGLAYMNETVDETDIDEDEAEDTDEQENTEVEGEYYDV